jgi:pimeloyl-[acyl-carrier protein] methyl ester esterase
MLIHTETYGTGSPLVFIHGWAMHSGIWQSFAKQLAQHYQVICIDLPGHGKSQKLSAFTLDNIAQALQKNLPDEPVNLIGWSLGGMIALNFANRFPNQVQTLTLIGSNPCFVKTGNWAGIKNEVLEKFAADLMFDCNATLLRFLSLQVKGLENHKTLLKDLKAALDVCNPPDAETLHSGLKILQQQDLRPVLAALSCPVQAFFGSHDTLVPVAAAEQIQLLNPRLTLQVIEKAAHVPFLSHPESILNRLKRFLEQYNQ